MTPQAEMSAVLVGMAVLAWCTRRVNLPNALAVVEKIGSFRIPRDDMKALGMRLEALGLPLSPELFSAGRLAVCLLTLMAGFFLILERSFSGVFILFATPVIGKFPDFLLEFRERKRKEELLQDFPLMVDQVKIYAKASGYYHALKIVSRSLKGPLGRELALLSAEMEIVGLIQAINNFAARCGLPEIRDFARIIVVEQTSGAEIGHILVNYSNMARQRQISRIKKKIKIQPILMSILPGGLLIIFILMFIIPMVTSIIQQLNAIN